MGEWKELGGLVGSSGTAAIGTNDARRCGWFVVKGRQALGKIRCLSGRWSAGAVLGTACSEQVLGLEQPVE